MSEIDIAVKGQINRIGRDDLNTIIDYRIERFLNKQAQKVVKQELPIDPCLDPVEANKESRHREDVFMAFVFGGFLGVFFTLIFLQMAK